jgi:DNA-3-methyladenine glycosylase II
MSEQPHIYLAKRCAVLRPIIKRVGEFVIEAEPQKPPYESLVHAIAHQQLHGKAATTILRRFRALYPGTAFPSPADIAKTPIDKLREVGLSNAKALAIRDVAEKTLSGLVPDTRALDKLSDDAIVERLTQVRGVGRWTVEMLLIFKLGRQDVLPVDDFGVRNGFRLASKSSEMPKPKELMAFGERWRPFRSAAAWYLWRATDLAKEDKAKGGGEAQQRPRVKAGKKKVAKPAAAKSGVAPRGPKRRVKGAARKTTTSTRAAESKKSTPPRPLANMAVQWLPVLPVGGSFC